MSDTDLTRQLRIAIKKELDRCDKVATPKICERISTKEGYLAIEELIIKILLRDVITPGAAIAQLEMELP